MSPAAQQGAEEAIPVSFVHQRQPNKLELSPVREAQLFGVKDKILNGKVERWILRKLMATILLKGMNVRVKHVISNLMKWGRRYISDKF